MSDERLRTLERAAAQAGPGTDDSLRLYSELLRTGLNHLPAMDRLWLVFRSPDAIAPLDKLAIAAELAGETRDYRSDAVGRLVWPVDATVLAEMIGLGHDDFVRHVETVAQLDLDLGDPNAVIEARALAAEVNSGSLADQLRFVLATEGQRGLFEAINDVADNHRRSQHFDMALSRRFDEGRPTLYIRGGFVTENSLSDTTGLLMDLRNTLGRLYERGSRSRVIRRSGPLARVTAKTTLGDLRPLCREMLTRQTGDRRLKEPMSFWAIRRALDFAVDAGFHFSYRRALPDIFQDAGHEFLGSASSLRVGSLLDA